MVRTGLVKNKPTQLHQFFSGHGYLEIDIFHNIFYLNNGIVNKKNSSNNPTQGNNNRI